MVENFNTSHVMVLLAIACLLASNNLISIHLMLWFYVKAPYIANKTLRFQYISCYGSILNDDWPRDLYCISIHLMLWFYSSCSQIASNCFQFQYISCYGSISLSMYTDKELIKFQYISCYGSIIY